MEEKTFLNKVDPDSLNLILNYLSVHDTKKLLQNENFTLNSKQVLRLLNRFVPIYLREFSGSDGDRTREITLSFSNNFKDSIFSLLSEYEENYPLFLAEKERQGWPYSEMELVNPTEERKRIQNLTEQELEKLEIKGYTLEIFPYSYVTVSRLNFDSQNSDKPFFSELL